MRSITQGHGQSSRAAAEVGGGDRWAWQELYLEQWYGGMKRIILYMYIVLVAYGMDGMAIKR